MRSGALLALSLSVCAASRDLATASRNCLTEARAPAHTPNRLRVCEGARTWHVVLVEPACLIRCVPCGERSVVDIAAEARFPRRHRANDLDRRSGQPHFRAGHCGGESALHEAQRGT